MSRLHHDDCIEVMATLPEASVDAVVTDPPYGLEFMGKEWDRLDTTRARIKRADEMTDPAKRPFLAHSVSYQGGASAYGFHARWAEAAYRVAKPSAYLLAFGGTRTVHRMTCALEDAGWIIRDMLVWGYASGFPKSKASLKPAWEPIVMARKPGPLRMLAIDECRIGTEVETWPATRSYAPGQIQPGGVGKTEATGPAPAGRWPANIVLTDPIFDGGIEGVMGGGETTSTPFVGAWAPRGAFPIDNPNPVVYGDTGTYSRFFLVPKAARSDREPVLGGLAVTDAARVESAHSTVCAKCGRQRVNVPGAACACPDPEWVRKPQTARANVHPTVKPVDLMRHLVRLVTPTGGVVLDPFLGSGTTAIAAEMEGFDWIGIEREAEYVAIAEARLNGTQRGLGLDFAS